MSEELSKEERELQLNEGITLSDEGRGVLRTGVLPDGTLVTDRQFVMLEISARVQTITAKHLLELTREIIEHYNGDAVAARQALINGDVKLEKMPKYH